MDLDSAGLGVVHLHCSAERTAINGAASKADRQSETLSTPGLCYSVSLQVGCIHRCKLCE